MQSHHDYDEHEHEDMDDVEDFISELAEEERRSEDDKHSKASNNPNDLIPLEKLGQLRNAFRPSIDIHNGMERGPENSPIACQLMKDVETFVRVCCQECEGRIFQGKERH